MAWLTRLLTRRGFVLVNLAVACLFFALFFLANIRYDVALRDAQYFNGWMLLTCIAVMMILTIRKRVVILPFGRVRRWLLIHYYLGFVTIAIFLVHTKFRLPNSPLEWLLWSMFVLVAVSGLFGALISKVMPPRLEARGERILFERIPIFRNQLATEAEAIARDSIRDGNTASIAKLYVDILARFFAGPRNVLAHLNSSNVPLARIMTELHSVERYLDDAGKVRLARMRELVEAKNNLDIQYANTLLMRIWLFLHIPPTYAMLVFAVVHVLLAYAFSTG
jgi:hypothetical protein